VISLRKMCQLILTISLLFIYIICERHCFINWFLIRCFSYPQEYSSLNDLMWSILKRGVPDSVDINFTAITIKTLFQEFLHIKRNLPFLEGLFIKSFANTLILPSCGCLVIRLPLFIAGLFFVGKVQCIHRFW